MIEVYHALNVKTFNNKLKYWFFLIVDETSAVHEQLLHKILAISVALNKYVIKILHQKLTKENSLC